MSKTIIAVRNFGLGGRESLETAVSGFTGNFTKQDVKKAAKLFSTIYLMPFGKQLFGKIVDVYLSKNRNLVFAKVC